MSWLVLVGAGLLEIGWAVALPATKGFTRFAPTTLFLVLLGGSMLGLSIAARSIPIGTAYAVWVGIGAVGTVLTAAVVHDQRLPGPHVVAVAALVVSIVAVKLTAPH